jgi:hypothetical protein
MKAFYCDHCGALVFFENVQCVKCGHALGFLADLLDLSALEPVPNQANTWRALATAAHGRWYRQCQNSYQHQVCNWLVADEKAFCLACRLNRTIPDLSQAGNRERWHKMELAKRRLLYTLLHLGLPLQGRPEGKRPALQFDFLAETPGGPPVLTGHDNSLITLSIAEADDAEREKRRMNLHEPYRTLLGHFRHEIAHYYWNQLIGGTPRLARFRELFGDERQDYAATLKNYYAQGAPADWQSRHVSAYASAHPWEDWAETWAHYLHVVDTLETAAGFGLQLTPKHPAAATMRADSRRVDEAAGSFDGLLRQWLPLTYALNSLNRGMGMPDLYPFVLSDAAVAKLRFVHDTVQEARSGEQKC